MTATAPLPTPATPPCVLAFDTATERLAVALSAPGGPWCVDAPGGVAPREKLSFTMAPVGLRLRLRMRG